MWYVVVLLAKHYYVDTDMAPSGSLLDVILALSVEDKGLTRKRTLSQNAQPHTPQDPLDRYHKCLGNSQLPI